MLGKFPHKKQKIECLTCQERNIVGAAEPIDTFKRHLALRSNQSGAPITHYSFAITRFKSYLDFHPYLPIYS